MEESQQNEQKLLKVFQEKEKEKRLLKRELKQLQEESLENEIQSHDNSEYYLDLQIQKEINLLKSRIMEDQRKKESLEFDLEELKKTQYSHVQSAKTLKKFNDIVDENEELEKFIKTEYYETAHETIHAYKMLAEEMKHEISQIEQAKEDLEIEQKKARESSSDLRRQISVILKIYKFHLFILFFFYHIRLFYLRFFMIFFQRSAFFKVNIFFLFV